MAGRWPHPGDSPIVRARKVAWAYRAALESAGRADLVAELDDRFINWDEVWITPQGRFEPTDWITAKQAGALLGVSDGTISKNRMSGRIKGRKVNQTFFYKVSDVYELSDQVRRRKTSPPVRVPDNGSSVSNG